MPRRVACSFVAVALLAFPAGALADDGAAAPVDATATVVAKARPRARSRPKARAPEATGRIGLRVAGAHSVNGRLLALAGRRLRIDGRIVPYVRGEHVSVRIWRGHKLLKRVTVRPKPTRTRRTATFRVRLTPERSGDLQVFAVHERSSRQRRLLKRTPLTVVTPTAGPGARGPFVALLQQRLAAVGYATPRSGMLDAATQRAVLAFRKVNGMARISSLDPLIIDRLMRGVGGFKVRFPQHGRHVEAHLGQQVLALIDRGKVQRAYITSSGTSVTPTVLGSFRFYMRTIGTNAKGMVDSNYFIRGYAIHGYVDVPTYPASHGCLRVPIPDARSIYDWVRIGDRIDVYY
ncbi:MAG TPA: L,D-transpeptidase family protein [Conexibacter sp.]|nr:L,D-transpeptidase family protein [Conexibacter sp.]